MSLCPICGRLYCDHTPDERGQTIQEMMAPLTPSEMKAWETEPPDSPKKIAEGQRTKAAQQIKKKKKKKKSRRRS